MGRMRRNEMLKIMHDLISEELCTREEFNVEDCNRLLTAMEAVGMLPPMSDETMSSNPFNVTDSILESVAHDFKWETE